MVRKPAKKAAKRARPVARKKPAAKKAAGGGRLTGLPKAEGAAAVRALLAKLSPEHRAIGAEVDALVAKHVPGARRAVRWSAPIWGIPGRGWFMSFASFKSYAKVTFFNGVALDPVPPEGESALMRSVNVASLAELDKRRMASWIRQAAAAPGWGNA